MLQYLDTFSGSIAFPELAVPIQAFLKTFLKKCKSAEIKRALKSLAEQVGLCLCLCLSLFLWMLNISCACFAGVALCFKTGRPFLTRVDPAC